MLSVLFQHANIKPTVAQLGFRISVVTLGVLCYHVVSMQTSSSYSLCKLFHLKIIHFHAFLIDDAVVSYVHDMFLDLCTITSTIHGISSSTNTR